MILDRPDELRVEGMPAATGQDVGVEPASDEGEVSDEVEDLVPHRFIFHAGVGHVFTLPNDKH